MVEYEYEHSRRLGLVDGLGGGGGSGFMGVTTRLRGSEAIRTHIAWFLGGKA